MHWDRQLPWPGALSKNRRFSGNGERREQAFNRALPCAARQEIYMRCIILFCIFIFSFLITKIARAAETCKVSVSVPPQKFLVERIGKSDVTVNSILGPGVNPHTHKVSLDDVHNASGSVVYFAMGFPFERNLTGMLVSRCDGLWVIPAYNGATHSKRSPPEQKGERRVRRREQHVWMCPDNVHRMIEIIARRLSEEMPEKKLAFRRNAEILDAEVDVMDREIRSRLDKLPADQRLLLYITPYWHYFTTHYGLETYLGPSPRAESLESDFADSVRLCRENGIKTVLAPPGYPAELARMMAKAINGKVILIDPLEKDWFDTMDRASAALLAPMNLGVYSHLR